jgi:hypothetical protein
MGAFSLFLTGLPELPKGRRQGNFPLDLFGGEPPEIACTFSGFQIESPHIPLHMCKNMGLIQ